MAKIDPIIQPFDESDPRRLRVGEIHRDKLARDSKYLYIKNNTQLLYQHHLFTLLQHAISQLSRQNRHTYSLHSRDEANRILQEFKSLLNQLITDDLSQSTSFSQQLSSCWHHIEAFEQEARGTKTLPHLSHLLTTLTTAITTFPPNQDQTLGHYLTKRYTHKTWLPFPYIDILKLLHEWAIENPATSPLNNWVATLDQILTSLKR
ncbi:MAG: hypothetical protein S4CHLAM102_07520 [Chlamydiia bacterium]|nr:hypothetical protein [Chlamydiia bacterium]